MIALLVASIRAIFGDTEIFNLIIEGTFDNAKTGFDLSIGLTGVLCLWMGIMKVGENGGAVNLLAKLVGPFFNKLFPDVPANHPARGSMLMNFSANMLGLDNAATPVGLKAMNELQELNPDKTKASNAQIMFLVLNTSGLTIIPVAVMNYRGISGAANPADVFLPILIATFFSSLIGLIAVAIWQKINLFNKVVLGYLGVMTALILGMTWYFNRLDPAELQEQSKFWSNLILYGIISAFIIMALVKKVNVYDSFIEGAKDGFSIAIKIIPYLIAMLVAIGVFRASGAMDYLLIGFEYFFALFFSNVDFVHGLPTALMKPLSGSGARTMMLESFQTYGVDSFAGKLNATLQGATDTTFYIIAVYFGSVGIKNTRYAIKAGLLADLAGIIVAIIVSYIFFKGTDAVYQKPIETANSFNNSWVNKDEIKLIQLMDSSCVFYDNAYDTMYTNAKEIYTNYLSVDVFENRNRSVQSTKSIIQNESETIMCKYQIEKDSVTFHEVLNFTIDKEKIQSIQYMNFGEPRKLK